MSFRLSEQEVQNLHDCTKRAPGEPFLAALLSWYLLTKQEWDSLSNDAQHRMLDRFTENLCEEEYYALPPEAQAELSYSF